METINDLECILIIDDDAATNFIHQRTIKKAGIDCQVEVFTTVEDALNFLKSEENHKDQSNNFPPGIIFLDINMPGLSGWDFMEEYKKLHQDKKADLIVTMLTTSLNPEDEQKVKEYVDIKEFFNKPLTSAKLKYLINEYF